MSFFLSIFPSLCLTFVLDFVLSFDHVFHPSTTQSDVYYEVSPMVQSAMDGFHSCIFAYGQTGSGKTYTMQGPPEDPGVYTRALHELFTVVDQREQTHKYTMTVSMVEIYNETIRDLLCEEKQAKQQAKSDMQSQVPTRANCPFGLPA